MLHATPISRRLGRSRRPGLALGVLTALLAAACAPAMPGDNPPPSPGRGALVAGAARTPAPAAARPPDAACAPDAGWNDPTPPRRVHGDTWYVGTCGITALLITGAQGHVLIDTGTDIAGPMVENNIRALGFRVEDVRYILVSHPHSDHVGGVALVQRDSSAQVVARAPTVAALREGRGDRSDPQFLLADGFPNVPAQALISLRDGETLRLGGLKLTAHATPGHTPGGTSWSWTSCGPAGAAEGDGCLHMVYADSVTPISNDTYRYGDPSPAGVARLAAARAGLARLAGLPCDVLLTPHPGASHLWRRLGPDARAPLVEPGACRAYAVQGERLLDARLLRERQGFRPGEASEVPPLAPEALHPPAS